MTDFAGHFSFSARRAQSGAQRREPRERSRTDRGEEVAAAVRKKRFHGGTGTVEGSDGGIS